MLLFFFVVVCLFVFVFFGGEGGKRRVSLPACLSVNYCSVLGLVNKGFKQIDIRYFTEIFVHKSGFPRSSDPIGYA